MTKGGDRLFDRAVLAAAVVAIVLVVGGLVWYGISAGSGPADLEATIAEAGQENADERLYEVTITNKGGTTAEDLIVEVTQGDESSELQIPFVTKGDREEVFITLPGGGAPEVRIVSYTEH